MPAPLVFLDIDGVLNSHDINAHGYNTIHRDKVARLNQLVGLTEASIVISSAWRYMILGGAMTVDGFRYMLMTYGLASGTKVVGCTVSDEEIPERGDQITAFLSTAEWPPYVVLDDGSETPQGKAQTMTQSLRARHGERWVLIDGRLGLTDDDVALAVHVLRSQTLYKTPERITPTEKK